MELEDVYRKDLNLLIALKVLVEEGSVTQAQFREPVHTLLFGTAPSGGAMFCKKNPIKNDHTKHINLMRLVSIRYFRKQQMPSLKAQFREPLHTLLFGITPSGGAMFCKKHPIKNDHTKRIN